MIMIKSNSKMIIISVTSVFCGLCNFVLNLLRRAVNVIGTIKNAANAQYSYNEPQSWLKTLGWLIDIKLLCDHSLGILSVVQIVSGIIGIIFVVSVNSSKKQQADRFRFFPFLCGVIMCLVGFLSFAIILLRSPSVIFVIAAFFTMIVIPVLFAVFSEKFWRGE